MAQDWAPFEREVRDKIVSLLKSRADADGVGVKEVLNHLHADRQKFESNGIYVVNAAYRRTRVTSNVMEGVLRFPIVCNSIALTDGEHQDVVGDLVGLVVDMANADPTLGGLVEAAEVEEIGFPEIAVGAGPEAMIVTQQVIIAAEIARPMP